MDAVEYRRKIWKFIGLAEKREAEFLNGQSAAPRIQPVVIPIEDLDEESGDDFELEMETLEDELRAVHALPNVDAYLQAERNAVRALLNDDYLEEERRAVEALSNADVFVYENDDDFYEE